MLMSPDVHAIVEGLRGDPQVERVRAEEGIEQFATFVSRVMGDLGPVLRSQQPARVTPAYVQYLLSGLTGYLHLVAGDLEICLDLLKRIHRADPEHPGFSGEVPCSTRTNARPGLLATIMNEPKVTVADLPESVPPATAEVAPEREEEESDE